MKIYHTSLNKGQDVHGIWQWMFGSFYTSVSLEEAELIFVVLFNHPFELDHAKLEEVRNSGKPIVVFDYWEENWSNPTYGLPFPELEALDVKAYFKREMNGMVGSGKWHPIDFYNFQTWGKTDTFEEFNARPIDILMCYGLSHPMRPKVHAAIMTSELWTYIDQPEYMEYEKGQFALCMFRPHYARIPDDELLNIQSKAKITISLPGSGEKCFRTSEAPINSVMAMPTNDLVWQAGWDETNCILVESDWPQSLKAELNNPEQLYQKYLNGTKIANNIKPETIWKTWILPRLTGL
jgi:hypothetical protein